MPDAAVPAPTPTDDEPGRSALTRRRLVAAIDGHVAKSHEPLPAGSDPSTAAQLYSEDSVELLLKAAELLRAGVSPQPETDLQAENERLRASVAELHATVDAAEDHISALLNEREQLRTELGL